MITRTTCRVCEGALEPILSLGDHFVSDFIVPGAGDGTRAPLDLVLCKRCYLLQLRHTVPAEHLYRNYWYRSGTNETMRKALGDIAQTAETLMHLRPGEAVLDIGCNDGTLLASYRTGGLYKIGYDPAENLAPLSRKVADRVEVGFFGAEVFAEDPELSSVRPKVITSIAMFYDLEDPKKFVSDVKQVLDRDGLWIVQMSYLPLMLKQHELGNVCHEHLEYYSLQSFEYLIRLFDMEVVDVELNDVNGGSFRTYVRNKNADPAAFGDATHRILGMNRVQELRESESRLNLTKEAPYQEFAIWCARIREDVVRFIEEQVKAGKKVLVYGASTKGNTVLQYYGLNASLIAAAAERNAAKWGRVTVGTHIPIVSEEDARAQKPDFFLVLPWHFVEEFEQREKAFLLDGGRFILPAPHFTLI